MKKILSILLALAMISAISVSAFAADTEIKQDSDPKTANTNVTYTVDSVYTVVIPETVSLGNDIVITSAAMNIDVDEKVNVTITDGITNSVVTLARTGDINTKLTSNVQLNGSDITNTTVVAQFLGNSTTAVTGTGTLSVGGPNETNIKAGSYTGTLIFSVELI